MNAIAASSRHPILTIRIISKLKWGSSLLAQPQFEIRTSVCSWYFFYECRNESQFVHFAVMYASFSFELKIHEKKSIFNYWKRWVSNHLSRFPFFNCKKAPAILNASWRSWNSSIEMLSVFGIFYWIKQWLWPQKTLSLVWETLTHTDESIGFVKIRKNT